MTAKICNETPVMMVGVFVALGGIMTKIEVEVLFSMLKILLARKLITTNEYEQIEKQLRMELVA